MLIVVSNPTAVADEVTLINLLFEEGLERFHLRKPGANADALKELIAQIKPEYRHQIALHHRHEIANDFNIKRLHFTEEKRKALSEEELIELRTKEYLLSTSIHTIKEYPTIGSYFEYTFFGPVFNSISKQGYTSALTPGFVFPVKQQGCPKVIAIGGIEAGTLQQVMDMNFGGVAVLGAIWQHPDKSIQQFKELKKTWEQTGHSY